VTFSIKTLSITTLCHYAECHSSWKCNQIGQCFIVQALGSFFEMELMTLAILDFLIWLNLNQFSLLTAKIILHSKGRSLPALPLGLEWQIAFRVKVTNTLSILQHLTDYDHEIFYNSGNKIFLEMEVTTLANLNF